jgi:hypothetical protein
MNEVDYYQLTIKHQDRVVQDKVIENQPSTAQCKSSEIIMSERAKDQSRSQN